MPHLYPPEYWHRQAHETRRLVAMLSLASDKLVLLEMAENYDRRARAAEERLREQEDQALLNRLRLHRVAALQSGALMRAIAAEMRVTIKNSRALMDRTREALHRADLLLSGMPFVRTGSQSPLD